MHILQVLNDSCRSQQEQCPHSHNPANDKWIINGVTVEVPKALIVFEIFLLFTTIDSPCSTCEKFLQKQICNIIKMEHYSDIVLL